MNRYFNHSLPASMSLNTLAIPLRAANQPRAGEQHGAQPEPDVLDDRNGSSPGTLHGSQQS